MRSEQKLNGECFTSIFQIGRGHKIEEKDVDNESQLGHPSFITRSDKQIEDDAKSNGEMYNGNKIEEIGKGKVGSKSEHDLKI